MSVVGTERAMSSAGLGRTLRALRDPLLLFAVPVAFALLLAFVGYGNSWPIGFDFRGTLWEPGARTARRVPIYPEPTRAAIELGNPAVYPPFVILLSVPLALLPVGAASPRVGALLGAGVVLALWILGVRDWRCHDLALASAPVLEGVFWGNLSLLILVPVALAWRYRDRALIGGLAVGAAVAAKLFVWPLDRLAAADTAVSCGSVGGRLRRRSRARRLGDRSDSRASGTTRTLLRAVQDVYAERSLSLATVAGGFGASVGVAVAAAAAVGPLSSASQRGSCGVPTATGGLRGRRRACVVATPIVWPNYAALLFVPIAIRWPRLAPAWFFGFVVWLAGALAPDRVAVDIGPPPVGVVEQAWLWSHATPTGWFATAMCLVVGAVGLTAALSRRHR